MKIFLVLVLMLYLIVFISCSTLKHSLRIVCYFDYQAPNRRGDAQFTVDDINSTLCTHLVYKYAKLNFTSLDIEIVNPQDIKNKGYEKVSGLKLKNPHLKVMIALHNWNSPAVGYTETQISSLITNVVDFLSLYQFDGIDLDIVHSRNDGFFNLVESLGRIKQIQNEYLLSLVLRNADVDHIDEKGISRLSQVLDFLNLKTYEFYYPTNQRDQKANHHAPLFDRSRAVNNANENVDSVVDHWISKGFPQDKIVIGIPLFGVGWTLSSNTTNPPAPANRPGALHGQTFGRKGYSAYYEICRDVLNNQDWQVFHDPDQKMGPYAISPPSAATNGRTWIGYDDPAMAIVKSEYILSKKLGGAAVSNVDMDDFRNRCRTGHNPMMTAIYHTLIKSHVNVFRSTKSFPLFLSFPLTNETTSIEAIAIKTFSKIMKKEERNRLHCDIALTLVLITSLFYLVTFIIFLFKICILGHLIIRFEIAL